MGQKEVEKRYKRNPFDFGFDREHRKPWSEVGGVLGGTLGFIVFSLIGLFIAGKTGGLIGMIVGLIGGALIGVLLGVRRDRNTNDIRQK